jgi:hypothetical protein
MDQGRLKPNTIIQAAPNNSPVPDCQVITPAAATAKKDRPRPANAPRAILTSFVGCNDR